MKIGKKMQEIRKLNSKNQIEIANQLGITQAVYSRYENDVIKPSIDSLYNLSNYYDVSIEYFLRNNYDIKKNSKTKKYYEYLLIKGIFLSNVEKYNESLESDDDFKEINSSVYRENAEMQYNKLKELLSEIMREITIDELKNYIE